MDTKVLLVTNDGDCVYDLREAFAGEGFSVTAVGSVEAALLQGGLSQPDLVVLDLPEHGPSLWSALERFRAASQGPIMVVNGPVSQGARAESLKHGADDVISREVGAREMQARARALVRRAQGAV